MKTIPEKQKEILQSIEELKEMIYQQFISKGTRFEEAEESFTSTSSTTIKWMYYNQENMEMRTPCEIGGKKSIEYKLLGQLTILEVLQWP